MDTVLPAFVSVFVMLFGVLSLVTTLLTTQDMLQNASQAMQTRLNTRARTSIVPISSRVTSDGTNVELVYRNQGTTKLMDFSRWDVVVQYMDNAASPLLHVSWLPFEAGTLFNNEWVVSGIYVNTAKSIGETFDRGILDPTEELKIDLKLAPGIGNSHTAMVTLGTTNGVTASTQVRRDAAPVLVTNMAVTATVGSPIVPILINNPKLNATDADNGPDALIYTITTLPTLGMLEVGATVLSLNATFTQADINSGRLIYTPTGLGNDTFQFTVSNGDSVIGPYSFSLSTK